MLYRNEIQMMNDTELLELIAKNALKVETTDYIDTDEVIEALELTEGTIYECAEDEILDSIYNGNWTQAAHQMLELYVTPNGLVDYIEDYRFENCAEAYEFFDLSSAVCITQLYEEARRVA